MASPVADAVWTLYAHVIARTGPLPTLIEWDNDVPDWPTLRAEAVAAQRYSFRRVARVGGMRAPMPAPSFETSFADALLERRSADSARRRRRTMPPFRRGALPSTATMWWPAWSKALENALSRGRENRRRGVLRRDGAGIRHGAAAALAAARNLWRRLSRVHRRVRTGARASLSRGRGAARGRAHPRLSCRRRRARSAPAVRGA